MDCRVSRVATSRDDSPRRSAGASVVGWARALLVMVELPLVWVRSPARSNCGPRQVFASAACVKGERPLRG